MSNDLKCINCRRGVAQPGGLLCAKCAKKRGAREAVSVIKNFAFLVVCAAFFGFIVIAASRQTGPLLREALLGLLDYRFVAGMGFGILVSFGVGYIILREIIEE